MINTCFSIYLSIYLDKLPEVHGKDIGANPAKLHDDVVGIGGVDDLEVFDRSLQKVRKKFQNLENLEITRVTLP